MTRTKLWLRTAFTLFLAIAGGWIATLLQLPAGWLVGAVVVVTTASLTGAPVALPISLRNVAFFILGVQAGSGVTPDVVRQMALWPLSFVIQMIGVAGVVAASSLFFRKVLAWDRDTALFASMPGAFSFIVAAASDTRADMTRVVIVQSVRLMLLIVVLVPSLSFLEPGRPRPAAVPASLGEYVVFLAICLLAAWIGVKSRIPGGLILGALVGSAVLHATGILAVPIPSEIAVGGLVILGSVIGVRIRREDRRILVQFLPASIGAFVLSLLISGAAAVVALFVLGLHFGSIALAYAPGAIEALTALAFQFDLDPAYVAAHHVVRFVGLALVIPMLVRRSSGRKDEAGEVEKDPPPRS